MLLDIAYQKGFLGLPFHRFYFNDNSLKAESLPSSRFKIPASIRANYFLGDRVVLRSFYRYYQDDWGLNAHTAELETAIKITPFISVSPFYRFYHQYAIDYFAPYQTHNVNEKYFSSNYDLSTFNSHFLGAGFSIAPPKGLFGLRHWNMLDLRYGNYKRSNTLRANIVTVNLKFK